MSALSQIRYTKSGTKVAQLTPTTFDYWVRFAPTAAPPTTLTITESTHGGGSSLSATGGDVFFTSGSQSCVPVSNSVSYSSGLTKVTFSGTKGTVYFVQVHYTAAVLVGQSLTAGSAGLTISTAEVTDSSNSISFSAG